MNRIYLIIKLIFQIKIIFKEPKKYPLVIFDKDSMVDLSEVVKKFDYFVMANRIHHIENIYISANILKIFIKNYKGNVMTAYLVSLLEVIKPKAVVTFIDNSEKFSDLAKALSNKTKFVAIQNAYRIDIIENNYLQKINKKNVILNKYFYIPKLLCFGQHNIDLYKKCKIKVKDFIKVGSLRLANALRYIKVNKIKLKKYRYDVCVVSDTASSFTLKGLIQNFNTTNKSPGFHFNKGMAYTVKYAIKFCIKHNKKFIFIIKTKNNKKKLKKELEFYKKYLSRKEFIFLMSNSTKSKVGRFTSYIEMFQSKVAVSTISTMLGENLALGKKILACNLTNLDLLDFPNGGICAIKHCSYEKFEKRLSYILSASNKKYFSKLSKNKNYIVSFSTKISTIKILQDIIRKLLS